VPNFTHWFLGEISLVVLNGNTRAGSDECYHCGGKSGGVSGLTYRRTLAYALVVMEDLLRLCCL
jgi:hypothetical protein